MDAADLVALQMNEQEMQVANHVLGTLFRDYLAQIREEQLSGAMPSQEEESDEQDSAP